MATLDSQTLSDLREDTAIGSESDGVFTDAQLQRLYDRAEGNYYGTIILIYRQLLADSVKLTRFKFGANFVDDAQVFEHIKAMLSYYEEQYSLTSSIRFLRLDSAPPRDKDSPDSAAEDTAKRAGEF